MSNPVKQHWVQWTPEKIETLWGAYIADHALTTGFYPTDFYEVVLLNVKKYLKQHMHCLDIGCGIGTLVQLLYRKGYQITGVDISSYAIEHVRQIFKQNEVRAPLLNCPLDRIPFKDGSFNVVFAVEVLEHLDYNYAITVLKEARRILSAEGIIVVTTPYCERLRKVVCPDCLAVFHPMGHVQSFDKTKAARILRQAGFDVIDICVFPDLFLYPDDNFTKTVMKRIIRRIFKQLLIKLRGHNLLCIGRKNENLSGCR